MGRDDVTEVVGRLSISSLCLHGWALQDLWVPLGVEILCVYLHGLWVKSIHKFHHILKRI